MKKLDKNIAKKYSQMYDEDTFSKVPAIPYDKNLKCIELIRTFCRGEYTVDLSEKTLGELVDEFYESYEPGGEFAEYGNPFNEFSEDFPTKTEFIQHITNGHVVKGIRTEEQEFLMARKDQELQMYEELERLESEEELEPDPEFEIIKNKRIISIKTAPIFKKGSEEAGMEIDIEEGVKEDYKKFDIEIPSIGEIIDIDMKEFEKIFKNTHKDEIDFAQVGCEIVKDIDVKNEMLYVMLGKHVFNEDTLSFLKDEQITYTHKPKINTVFYSRSHKGPIFASHYFDTGFKGGGIEYWTLVPDKSHSHLPLVTAVPFSIGVDNWAEYKNWLETQKIFKKGSEEAGIEIDIEESKKTKDLYNTTEVINKIKQRFGTCTYAFCKWLYEEDFADFDSDLSLEENIRSIWENMVENGIDGGMSKSDSIEQAQNYLDSNIEMFENSKAYKNCLEIQAVYKKGSKEAGMEIDIEENAKGKSSKKQSSFYLDKKSVFDPLHPEDPSNLYNIIKQELGDFTDTFYKWLSTNTVRTHLGTFFFNPYEHLVFNLKDLWDDLFSKDYIAICEDGIDKKEAEKMCLKTALKDLESIFKQFRKSKEYEICLKKIISKKTEPIYKKGSEEAGIDIDIEENAKGKSSKKQSLSALDKKSVFAPNDPKDPSNLYNIIKQELGDCAYTFYKWLGASAIQTYSGVTAWSPEETFEQNLEDLWDDLFISGYLYTVKDGTDEKTAEKICLQSALKELRSWFREFRKSKEYKNYVKTQAVYKKGSKEAGMEIDIEENAKSKSSKKQILADLEKKFKFIDPYNPEDPINLYSILQQEFGACADSFFKGIGWHYLDSFEENLEYLWYVAFVEDYNEALEKGMDEEEAKKKCFKLALYFLEIDYFKKFRESKEYEICLKTQAVLKKGSKEAGMEIDIEENAEGKTSKKQILTDLEKKFKLVDPIWPEDPINLYNILRQEFGACADSFFKGIKKIKNYWGYREPSEDFEENLYFLWNIVFIEDYTKALIKTEHLGTNEKEKEEIQKKCFKSALRNLEINYFSEFRKSEIYKNCVKTQAVYKKGSEEAGMEIDIEENAKDFMPVGAGDTFYFTKKYIGIENKNEIFDFIKFLDTYIKPKQRKTDANTVDSMYEQMTWDAAEKLPSTTSKGYYRVQDEELALCRKKIIQQLWEKYELWQKAQEVLKKGSKEAGVDIDI